MNPLPRLMRLLAAACCLLPPAVWAESATAVIGPGDEVEVRVLDHAEFDVKARVGADGRMQAPIVGTLQPAGMTPAQLQQSLAERIGADYLVDPVVTVNVQRTEKRKIFVLGEVVRPGAYEMEDSTTAVKSIALAGGLTKFAAPRITILRAGGDGKSVLLEADIESIVRGRAADLPLEPGDIVSATEKKGL